MKYKFYYSYQDEVYGVIAEYPKRNVLEVELIRTNEKEEVWSEWFQNKVEEGMIDISKDPSTLKFHKKEELSKHLPTSS